ncbi:dipeptide/oligopeptide/nickel ABC transporter permease/ATP-binding protein [Nocardioides insulae]|uniref:dipeptide/oligopeptide/nickel ABC transporter permease/ATP-binding protein n=1 Tax=Nocardioides insulae TaxID=394734 RepID=UPI000406BD11|nr:dipeptide/oligopeptide/nickel ABC transporter permease/ATP-binding protein [Nocardioides insulae]
MSLPTDPTTAATLGHAIDPEVRRAGLVKRLVRIPTAVVALVWLVVVVAAAVLAPLLTSQSPTASDILDALAPRGPGHPLGTDGVGRDVWAQLIYGARTSLVGALIVVIVSLVVGLPAGLIAGYFRGRFDGISTWIASLLMAQPAIIILLVVLTQVGRNTALAMFVFGFVIAPGVFRLVRASVIAVREELFVDAARVSGLTDPRLIRRHILPVVVAPTVIQMSQIFGIAIVVQAGLEFLGLGSANQASWGGMLNDAFQAIYTAPRLLVWPALAIILTVTACALLGNALRDALGGAPAARRRRRRKELSDTGSVTVSTSPDVADDVALQIDSLVVSYPGAAGDREVVHGVSLAIRRGEVLGLVGESGSGKSQTAFSVLGLLPGAASMSADRIQFHGEDLTTLSGAAMNRLRGRRIGYIPQEPMSNLDPSFRVGSQLVDPMRHHLGLSRKDARAEALRLLERVGIRDPERVFDAYPHQISGGMAQRVLIAGAVSCNPELLIADEPTTALDVTVQAEVLDLIRELQAEREMAVLLVTHNFGVVADICDTVAVMRDGRIVEVASADDLFSDPQDAYTRMLLESSVEGAPARKPLPVIGATR